MNDNALLAATRAKLREEARSDFYLFYTLVFPQIDPGTPFSHSPHFKVLATAFEKVITGETPKLLVALPPRFGKSVIGSIALPAFILGNDPAAKIICGSYGDALSRSFAQKTRELMVSPTYTDVFGQVLTKKDGALEELQTVEKGYRFATSVNGVVTGKGANIIIIDDPLKAIEADSMIARETSYNWVKSTLMSRFDPGGVDRMIVIMQRLHQDDLIGRLMADGGWTVLEMPAEVLKPVTYDIGDGKTWSPKVGDALFPDGVSLEALAERRLNMTEAAYNSQFLQQPQSPQGALFKMKYIQRYEPPKPYAHNIEMIVQSWDPALSENDTAAFSVCTTWAICGKNLYLLDVFRKRLEYPRLAHAVLNLQNKWKAQYVIIETTGIGRAVFQDVRSRVENPVIFQRCEPKLGKSERAIIQLPRFENRRIFFPTEAPWLEIFEAEVAAFPLSRFSDQVDSMIQFCTAVGGLNIITLDLKECTQNGLPW